jgi:hypothetical protein
MLPLISEPKLKAMETIHSKIKVKLNSLLLYPEDGGTKLS